MNVWRIRDPDALQPLHVVMICLVVATMAGGMLLLSAARPTAVVDGAIEWREGSVLRAVVELICLNHNFPTQYAGDVKNYVLGMGAGLAIVVLCLAIAVRPRTPDEQSPVLEELAAGEMADAATSGGNAHKPHIAPLLAAQTLIVLYVAWSFVSSRWSSEPPPHLAVGASILVGLHVLWSLAIGHGLSQAAARIVSRMIVGVLALTAVLAIWYHYGRNPNIRADIPVGNPAFLASCMIPGMVLATAHLLQAWRHGTGAVAGKRIGAVVFYIAAIALCAWAFRLADSRGGYVGLAFAGLAIGFFALRGRMKIIPIALAVAVVVGGWLYLSSAADAFSPTGRSATLRLRTYAWGYAWNMFLDKPLTGSGQGSFTLLGDSHAVNDVLHDPIALENRIAHVHNEWLEVLADLGSIGFVLIVGGLGLTLLASMAALSVAKRHQQWPLIGLLSALVGIVVAETFSVGLRVSAVPTALFTILGLIWAQSGQRDTDLAVRLGTTGARRAITGVAGCLIGLAVLALAHQDFVAARNVYQAKEAMDEGEFEEAVRLAALANDSRQLNPQRALTNLYTLSQAHLRLAGFLQSRAMDRQQRAREMAPPPQRLLALAAQDYQLSDEQCEQGGIALKELLVRSPGFIHHGRLGYQLNLIRAQNAAVRGETEKEQALVLGAAAALERELLRQPFDPVLAGEFVRLTHTSVDLSRSLEVLARPLRHHRIQAPYIDVLAYLTATPESKAAFDTIVRQALAALAEEPTNTETGEPLETWSAEILRLAAMASSLRGEYQAAETALEAATSAYDRLRQSAPLGAASSYAELADVRFFAHPRDSRAAIAAAQQALRFAPQSRRGRELQHALRTRMVNYHLAGGREKEAVDLLRATGPANVSSEELDLELGARYRRLCESLLGRRDAGGELRKPPHDLLELLRAWIARAVELNSSDPGAHFLSADLAFYAGEHQAAAAHLRRALDAGLPPEAAARFLNAARKQMPESEPLLRLWIELGGQQK